MTKEIIVKFLNNQCSEKELEMIVEWAKNKSLNKESFKWAFEDWELFQIEEQIDSDERFQDLFDEIQFKIDNISKSNKIKKRGSVFSLTIKYLTKAAAILLIPVLGFLFYTLSDKNERYVKEYTQLTPVDSLEIIAPIGSRTVVQLSDGSEVHLNYGSKLKYPQIFNDKVREVNLVGEGYFIVEHQPEKPFIVKTNTLNVKALGTEFNVLAYPETGTIETTLVKGKVALEQEKASGINKSIGAMVPGQHVIYNKNTGEINSTKGGTEKYTAWKDGKLIFEDTPLVDAAEKLGRMYNVDIKVDNDIKDYPITVTLIDEPLFQILDLMCIATPVNYVAIPRKKLTDGTFSKQIILIERKNK